MTSHLVSLAAALTIVCAVIAPVAAQESRTVTLAQELVGLLEQRSLEAAAARLDDDEFTAVLYIPGVQILAVSAQYAAPALLHEKIVNQNYRDVYLDLASASVPETKVFIEDMDADGLRPDRRGDDPFDVYTMGTGAGVSFDGEYESRDVSQAQYLQTFSEAETAYERMLEALLAELKKSS